MVEHLAFLKSQMDKLRAEASRGPVQSSIVFDLTNPIMDMIGRNELAAAEGVKPRVKPMEWWRGEDETDPSWEGADTIVGRYSIENGKLIFTGVLFAGLDESIIAVDGDLKAKAQADYDRRILSVIQEPATANASHRLHELHRNKTTQPVRR